MSEKGTSSASKILLPGLVSFKNLMLLTVYKEAVDNLTFVHDLCDYVRTERETNV